MPSYPTIDRCPRVARLSMIWALALCIMTWVPGAVADDDAAARAAAADRYFAAVPMKSMLDDIVQELSMQVPPERRDAFVAGMQGSLRADRLEQIARDAVISTFTAEEINGLAQFYESGVGKSVLRKFGVYMGQIMPAIQQEVREAYQRLQSMEK